MAEKKTKRARKMIKTVEQDYVKIEVVGMDFTGTYKPADLPADVQAKLPAIALGHILGDACGGLDAAGIVEALGSKWKALKAGKFSVRKPAAPKLDKAAIMENFGKLKGKDKESAAALLKTLGIPVD